METTRDPPEIGIEASFLLPVRPIHVEVAHVGVVRAEEDADVAGDAREDQRGGAEVGRSVSRVVAKNAESFGSRTK
jgi:hypothetical protein